MEYFLLNINNKTPAFFKKIIKEGVKMVKKFVGFLCAVMLVIGVVASAGATVITFEDVPNADSGTWDNPIPNGYYGFNWTNFYVLHENYHPNSGYDNGSIEPGDWVAYNGGGEEASIECSGSFNFDGAFFTAAWNHELNINIKGYRNGNLLYDQTIVVDTSGSIWFDANFDGIDKLVFSSFGGTDAGLGGSGTHFAMDNFTYCSSCVPLPSTVLLLGSGLVGFVSFSRKRFSRGEA